MRRVLTLAVVTLAFVACKKPEAPPRPASSAAAQGQAPAPGKDQVMRGKVLEKIDVSQYSYLKLATASGEVWTAVQRTDKKVGDEVGVGNAFPMQGFESKELNRKFDVVYFGQLAGAGGEVAAMPPAMGGGMGGAMGGGMPGPGKGSGEAGVPPNPAQMAAQHQAVATGPADAKVDKVAKAGGADARTVEEIWGQREKLKGKPVTVRGQVVKFTPVMGKNFLHLRDGSGNADKKNNDVTVTTADSVAVGDVVTAKGVIAVDKDFGSGYAYPVMIEDAKVAK
jgi:hypothetical protein